MNEHRSPYTTKNTLLLHLTTPQPTNQHAPPTLQAKILKPFNPFTLSCLFDRRFATQHREDWTSPPWTLQSETQYQEFIANDSARAFFAQLAADKELAEDGDDEWDTAQEEAFLYYHMRGFYEREVEAYDMLDELQGKNVPRLFTKVTLEVETLALSDPSVSVSREKREYIDIPGLLLQCIDRFPLPDLADYAPRETWQSVCDEAIRIVNVIMDTGILHQDVNVRSFVVCMDQDRGFEVFMLDFAMCKFRRESAGEEDWRRWQAIQDQEGAVGVIMEKRLKGGFVYRRSAKASQLQAEFKREG